jgi:hypothetical protein
MEAIILMLDIARGATTGKKLGGPPFPSLLSSPFFLSPPLPSLLIPFMASNSEPKKFLDL